MLSSNDDQSPLQPGGAGVIALVALLGGWLWVQDLPRSFREAEPPLHPAVRVLPDGVVDARLWQDPFSAVSEHLTNNTIKYDYVLGDEESPPVRSAPTPGTVAPTPSIQPHERRLPENYRLLEETWAERPGRRIVLVGLLRGVSGAEEAERRRRQRHAMVSALAVSGLEPAHGTSLGWVWYRDEQRDLRLPIFFEQFDRTHPGSPRLPETVLVLWMNEDQIGSYTVGRDPLAVISEMVATFLDPILPSHDSPRKRLTGTEVRIIGPGSSDALRKYFARESTTALPHYIGKLPRAAENVLGWSPWNGSMTGTFCAAPLVPDCETLLIQEIQELISAMVQRRDAVRQAARHGGRRIPATQWRQWEPHVMTSIDRYMVGWVIQSTGSVGIGQDLCRDLRQHLQLSDESPSDSCPQDFSDAKLGQLLSSALDEFEATPLTTTLDGWTQWIRRNLPTEETLHGLTREEWSRAILHQWLLEWTSPKNSLKSIIRSDLTIHSSRATAPIEQLTDLPPGKRGYLRSAVADDETVLAAVVGELRHRGLELAPGSKDHVVLISEWDTTYGRIMPELFHKLVPHTETCGAGCDEADHKNLHRFSYLRGLDGIVPRSPLSDDEPDQGGGSAGAGNEGGGRRLEPLEVATFPLQRRQTTAFGRNQVDHVERIRRAIVRQDLELRHRQAGRIRAIGVLGSDFHDKQLILQVLRREFRHAVFFTTDLDARYFDPDKQGWNRNLLVGSSFGLTLRPTLQMDIPPFRDSYSTAAFLATLSALHETPDPHKFQDLERWLTPRLFEISRSGAVDLTPELPPDTDRMAVLHPLRELDPWFPNDWAPFLMLLPLAFVAIISITPVITGAALGWRRWLPLEILLFTGLLGLVLVLLTIGHHQEQSGLGEFVRWLDGVSVWPTEILRLIVLGMAFWILWHTGRRLRRVETEITEQFFASSSEPEGSEPTPVRPTGLRKLLDSIGRSTHLRNELADERTLTPEATWNRYRRLACSSARWLRTAIYLIVFLCAFFAVFWWLGVPDSPARGALALWIDRGLQISVITAVFTVTLWLFDATFLAWLFVRRLAVNRAQWSSANLSSLVQRWGVHRAIDVTEVAEIEVIARLTRGLWPSLGAPFLLVGLLVVSRSRFFDGWTWPISLVVLFVAVLAIALASAVLLRFRAQRARREALRSLTERSSQREGDGTDSPKGRASVRQIELMAEAIRNERRGALGGWWASPLARTGILVAVVLILMLLDLTYA